MPNDTVRKTDALPDSVVLPSPRPGRGGLFKGVVLLALAIACLGCAVYWLTRDEQQKDELRAHAADAVNGMAEGTPLAGIGNALIHSPPPPPPIHAAPSEPGTLAGSDISAPVGGNSGSAENGMAETGQGTSGEILETIPPVTEDREITPAYIGELARWIAAKYRPASRALDASAQSLNHFGGVSLAGQAKGGRAGILRYAFQPSMVKGLYDLYITRFMADLDAAAAGRGLTQAQNRQFHHALSGKAAMWASALEGTLAVRDLKDRLQKIDGLAQKAVDVNMELADAVFELDGLREQKASQTQLNASQLRVDGLAARYRRASEDHAAAQRALAAAIRSHSGQALDNDTLLFIAAWVERRMASGGEASSALQTCASVLKDLSRRCALAATGGSTRREGE